MTIIPEDLVVAACLASSEDTEAALRRWESGVPMDDIDGGSQRLVPYLYRKLERLGITARNHGILKGIYTRYWYLFNVQGMPTLTSVNAVLDPAEYLVLKGLALQTLVYGSDPPTRPCDDMDILVRQRDRGSVHDKLTAAGFRADGHKGPDIFLNNKIGINMQRGPEAVDLQWGLYTGMTDPGFEDRLFSRKIAVTISGFPAFTLSPTDHLLHTLMHGAARNSVSPIRWVLDASLLISQTTIDWTLFVAEVKNLGWAGPVARQLRLLQSKYGVEIPDAVLTSIVALKSPWAIRVLDFSKNTSSVAMSRLLMLTTQQPLIVQQLGLHDDVPQTAIAIRARALWLYLQGARQELHARGLREFFKMSTNR